MVCNVTVNLYLYLVLKQGKYHIITDADHSLYGSGERQGTMKKLNDNKGLGTVEIMIILVLAIIFIMVFKEPVTILISKIIILLQSLFATQ